MFKSNRKLTRMDADLTEILRFIPPASRWLVGFRVLEVFRICLLRWWKCRGFRIRLNVYLAVSRGTRRADLPSKRVSARCARELALARMKSSCLRG